MSASWTGTAVEDARHYLASVQHIGGGWGYQAGRAPFVEPTALCVLALAVGSGDVQGEALRAGAAWLRDVQHADGSWGVSRADAEGSWATAWAIWALAGAAASPDLSQTLLRAVAWWEAWQPWVGAPGQERDPQLWIDPTVPGWPWSRGGASWVEPTALGIIALGAAGRQGSPRVADGVRYLRDRACAGGGWNVGNPYMLGQSLPPAIPPTALALLALQTAGVPQSDATVTAGLTVQEALLQEARTPLNLAWGLWAARRYGRPSEALTARLRDQQAPDGGWRGSPYVTALAIQALGEAV